MRFLITPAKTQGPRIREFVEAIVKISSHSKSPEWIRVVEELVVKLIAEYLVRFTKY